MAYCQCLALILWTYSLVYAAGVQFRGHIPTWCPVHVPPVHVPPVQLGMLIGCLDTDFEDLRGEVAASQLQSGPGAEAEAMRKRPS